MKKTLSLTILFPSKDIPENLCIYQYYFVSIADDLTVCCSDDSHSTALTFDHCL